MFKNKACIIVTLFFSAIAVASYPQTNNTLHPYIAAVFANNADTIRKWYVQNLDFVIKDHKDIPEQHIHFYLLEKDGFLLEIIQRSDVLDAGGIKDTMKTHKYLSGFFKTGFYVDDIRAWYNRLKTAGVKIESDNVSGGKKENYILCADPEGNLVQLFQQEERNSQQAMAADIDSIKQAILQTAKAINNKDADGIMAYYSKDIIVSYPGTRDTRYDQFYESYKQMLLPRAGFTTVTVPIIEEILVSGDLASVRMTWETTIVDTLQGKSTTRKARDLQVWKRENGTWKFIRGMWYHEKQQTDNPD